MPAATRPASPSRPATGSAKEIAAICSDTWGIEVRPNETEGISQPLHWVTIPAMGVVHGEMFF